MVLSNGTETPTGAFESSEASWATALRFGEFCGQCGLFCRQRDGDPRRVQSNNIARNAVPGKRL